jgi:hypothetical protein
MAWVYNLLNDDTTITLNGGTSYALQPNGFSAPPPKRRQTFGGANYFRDGSDLMQRRFANRQVTVNIWIKGSSQDTLITNINAINDILERGSEYSRTGLGSQLKLRRQWDNATNTSDFNVIEGVLNVQGDAGDVHRFSPSDNYRIPATLVFVCEPFILGASETIENFVDNASFEITDTDLANWTQNIDATGSTALDTTQQKFGLASMKLTMTDSGGSGQVVERTQTLTDVDAAEVWSFSAWVHVTAVSNAKAGLILLYNDGSATTTTVYQTAVTSDWTLLSLANQTAPSGATQVIVKLRLEATAADATGVAYFDGVTAVLAASLPDSFVTSRNVGNSYADDSQATTNYIDVYPAVGAGGGDVPALMQLRLAGEANTTSVYAGARHGSRHTDDDIWIEGEGGTTSVLIDVSQTSENTGTQAGMNTSSAALDSESSVAHVYLENTAGTSFTVPIDSYFRTNFTIASPPEGQFRVLARAGWESNTGSGAPERFSFGLSYTYGGFTLLDDTNPSRTNFDALNSSATEQRGGVVDLGTITIPPVGIPENMTGASLVLKVFYDLNTATPSTHGQQLQWFLDAIMLMPIDAGGIYLSKPSATDVLLIDSLSKPSGVYILNSSDVVQSFPTNQLGTPPTAHPDGTRIYFAFIHTSSWVIASGAKARVTVVPRFLYVR